MNKEYYKIYRPRSFKTVKGQSAAVATLQKLIDQDKIPHALLFVGPSGCGKTTLARIIATHLDCGERDFVEINCADFRGVDMVRDIRNQMGFRPLYGSTRVWLVDEAHMLTREAQAALLKMLEDSPDHVYFILATTDALKLHGTIKTRCTEILLVGMNPKDLQTVIERVVAKEGLVVAPAVMAELILAAESSARKALVLLEQIAGFSTEKEQLIALRSADQTRHKAIELAKGLLYGKGWSEIAAILKDLEDEDPEGLRYMVLYYCRSVMLGGGKLAGRSYAIVDIFSHNFYDSKKAGLAAACWEVVFAGRK